MERFVPIRIEELVEAFEKCRDNSTRYLDTESGNISTHRNTKGDTDSRGNKIDGENPFHQKKFLEIPSGFYETYRDMEEFLETVSDKYLKAALGSSLAKPNSFKVFTNTLKRYPEENGRWYKFRRQKISTRVRVWLEQHDLKIQNKEST